jgi:putative membrane protein insertion efficiency factor
VKLFKLISIALINFYQKYLTVLSFGSCRYYPTCSSYAKQQFDTNGFFKALYHTITRILKCNQLFVGGIDYPYIKRDFKHFSHKRISVKYWYVPYNDGYLIIKNWDRNL